MPQMLRVQTRFGSPFKATRFFVLSFSGKRLFMRKIKCLLLLLAGFNAFSQQTDSSHLVAQKPKPEYTWIFSSPKLINANTVEMIPAGFLEFKVAHNFGDIAGDNGGIENFFGLDNAQDIRIGFQYGVSKKVNLIAARAKGADQFPNTIELRRLYELGIKYRLMQQANDPAHPFSISLFGNIVACAMKAQSDTTLLWKKTDNSFETFSDRLSETLQLMIARKFGKVSLQLSPTIVYRHYVMEGDQNAIFALGGAIRLPVVGKFSVIADYFHSFLSQSTIDFFKDPAKGGLGSPDGVRFYDAFGIGAEFLTEGHVFHLNFTNAIEILENRLIPRNTKSWGKGEYRWAFTISRDFDLLWKKRNRKK